MKCCKQQVCQRCFGEWALKSGRCMFCRTLMANWHRQVYGFQHILRQGLDHEWQCNYCDSTNGYDALDCAHCTRARLAYQLEYTS